MPSYLHPQKPRSYLYYSPMAKPKTTAYAMSISYVWKEGDAMLATPAVMMAALLMKRASTRGWSLIQPHATRPTVFMMPISEMMKVADAWSMPSRIARSGGTQDGQLGTTGSPGSAVYKHRIPHTLCPGHILRNFYCVPTRGRGQLPWTKGYFRNFDRAVQV